MLQIKLRTSHRWFSVKFFVHLNHSLKHVRGSFQLVLMLKFSFLTQVTPRLSELQLFRLQQGSQTVSVLMDQKEISGKRKEREKRKPVSDVIEQSPAKRQKGTTEKPKKSDTADKNQVKTSVEANKEGVEVEATKTLAENDRETKDLSREKPKHYKDQCTAFISNLSFQASYNDLSFLLRVHSLVSNRQKFSSVGTILI